MPTSTVGGPVLYVATPYV